MADVSSIVGPWTRYEDTIKKSEGNGSDLGKEDFLKLLVAQLTHQDPTNPMDDTQFITQLATYSSLEQQMATNDNLEELISVTKGTSSSNAVALIDKVVGWVDEEGNLVTDQVSFVDIEGGNVYLYTAGGQYVPFNSISYVGTMKPTDETQPATKPDTNSGANAGTNSGTSGTGEAAAI